MAVLFSVILNNLFNGIWFFTTVFSSNGEKLSKKNEVCTHYIIEFHINISVVRSRYGNKIAAAIYFLRFPRNIEYFLSSNSVFF